MNTQLQQWLQEITQKNGLQPEVIPNIDLYMDQVTTLLENQLQDTRRYDTDKIMTKTMINNYTKEDLLPPSNKKKYSKHHILLLGLIYQYKQILTIGDIQTLIKPFIENEEALLSFYTQYLDQDAREKESLKETLSQEPQEDLRLLASTLITRASLEKRLAEKILDQLHGEACDYHSAIDPS